MINPEDYEPDPDDLTREELAEHNPMWRAVADTLDEWLHRMHGVTSSNHFAGSFLDWLAMNGYRVEPIDPGPPIEEVLAVPSE